MEKYLEFHLKFDKKFTQNVDFFLNVENDNYIITYKKSDLSKLFTIILEHHSNMKYYYIGREYLLNYAKDGNERSVLSCFDGNLYNSNYICRSEDEALGFCYFLTVQRNKYNMLTRKFIKDLIGKGATLFIKYYDFLETLRWNGTKKEFKDFVNFFEDKINENHINPKNIKFNLEYIRKIEKIIFDNIEDYFNTNPIKNISGITSITLYRSSKYNKNIYLLGESHDYNIQCDKFLEYSDDKRQIFDKEKKEFINLDTKEGIELFQKLKEASSMHINSFVNNILNSKAFFVDFFLESWYWEYKEGSLDRLGNLGNIHKFNELPCFERDAKNMYSKKIHKGNPKCDFMRLESIDYRKKNNIHIHKLFVSGDDNFILELEKPSNIALLFSYLDGNYGITHLIRRLRERDYVKNIVNIFRSGLIDDFTDKLKNMFYKDNNFLKEIKKSYLGEEIIEILDESVNDIVKEAKSTIKSIFFIKVLDFFSSNYQDNELFYSYINSYIIHIEICIMDTFLISKLFKKMKHDKDEEHGPDEVRNCIVYTGDRHSINCGKILERFGFTKESYSGVSSYFLASCVNIENFSQPFFKFE